MTMVLAVDNTRDNTTCNFCGKVKWKEPKLTFIDNQKSGKDRKVICSDCITEAKILGDLV